MSILRTSILTVALGCSSYARAEDQPYTSSAAEAETPKNEAATELALDLSYAAGGSEGIDLGGGGALRVGRSFPFRWASLVPEVGVDAFGFGGTDSAFVYGGFAGGRARFGRGFHVGLSSHFGVTGLAWDRGNFAAPAADVGMFVELTYFERLLLGIQGEYKSTIASGGNSAISWYTAGLTVGTRL